MGAEYDASITAYFTGDLGGLEASVTGADTLVGSMEKRFEAAGIVMAGAPKKFAEASAAAFTEVFNAEDKLAAMRKQTLYDQMSDEDKLKSLRMDATGILGRINEIEGNTVEKVALQVQFEEKKRAIYSLNQQIAADTAKEQKGQTEETAKHTGLMGALEEGGKKVKKAFHEMGVTLHGAGIGLIFAEIIKLGREAITEAQKQREEYEKLKKPLDANTAALASFGDGLAAVKHGAAASIGFIVSGWNLIGDAIGQGINRLRGINEAQEVAAAASEKAAKMQEERLKKLEMEQHDIEKIAQAGKALAEAQTKAALDRATGEEKWGLLVAENIKLRMQLQHTEAGTVLYYERQAKLLENGTELTKLELELVKEKAAIEGGQLKNDQALALTYHEKAVVLGKERNVLLTELHQLQKGSNDYLEVQNKLDANNVALVQLNRDYRAKSGLEQADRLFMFKVEKGLLENMNEADGERYRLLKLQAQEKRNQVEIYDLLEKKLVQGLTPQDEKRLKKLLEQNRELGLQEAAINAIIAALKGGLIPATDAVTEHVMTQEEAWDRITGKVKKTQGEVIKLQGIIAGIMTSKAFGDEETPVLKERIRRNQEQVQQLQFDDRTAGTPFVPNPNSGEIGRLTLENQNIQRELDLRTSTLRTLQTQGVEAARKAFPGDPRAFDDFLRLITNTNTAADKTNALLERIGNVVVNTLGG